METRDDEIINLESLLMDLESAKLEIERTSGYTKETDLICFLEELVKEQGINEDTNSTAC